MTIGVKRRTICQSTILARICVIAAAALVNMMLASEVPIATSVVPLPPPA